MRYRLPPAARYLHWMACYENDLLPYFQDLKRFFVKTLLLWLSVVLRNTLENRGKQDAFIDRRRGPQWLGGWFEKNSYHHLGYRIVNNENSTPCVVVITWIMTSTKNINGLTEVISNAYWKLLSIFIFIDTFLKQYRILKNSRLHLLVKVVKQRFFEE
jgi:hypothetical protein